MEKAEQNFLLTIQNPTSEFQLREAQWVMLQLSEEDIKNSRLISQDDLDKEDEAWLNEW